ncbi:CDP-diacylglycerol--glycerol-3-phosphate 3-phosphatidyltransferase [Streptodolium elevatio]|uniref:CDP-diacylglycerol--glycerol-3-phosphate 3-phosphatidyltransferase n=1 Tax=Streptodolium elevatio TaxID=3157996 RepID=A0ABV3DJY6_9ACTN
MAEAPTPAGAGQRADENAITTDRVLTIPNLLSFGRLLGVPVFLWLILWPEFGGPKHDVIALVILMVSGFTDWLDGKLARRWNQISRVGQILDPAADRLYILSTLVGLTVRDILPLWVTGVLVARELFIAALFPYLRAHGYGLLPVNFIGKAATFNLMYSFPCLLLSDGTGRVATLAAIFGWAFAWWGIALYWWAGVLYAVQARRLVSAVKQAEAGYA